MSQELALNISQALQLPTYLQGADLGVSTALLATAGLGGNRIGLKGNRFRQIVNGKEEGVWDENYLDVIIIGAVPHISRIFYEGTYQQDVKAAPTCYSADGIAPPDDVKAKQSTKCEICPKNQKGSKIVNGQKLKACAYFQRLVVMLAGDMEGIKYTVDVKAMGIFGESHANVNKYNIRDYTKLLANRGADVATLVTRLSFDTDQSVPKLLFQPQRFITAEEYEVVKNSIGTPELDNMLKINMTTVDLSGEVDAEETAVEARAEETTEQVQEIADATPTHSAQGLTMTAKADGVTYDEFVKEGWTDEDMIAEGYAEAPKPVVPPKPAAPTPPPKPVAPKPAAASTAPAKPAATAAQQPVKRGPGRPPATTQAAPKPAAAAAPAPQKPAAQAAPKPAPRPAVPTVQKGVPMPTATQAASAPVTETTNDDEVNAILASLE
jgi:hypothetical protein